MQELLDQFEEEYDEGVKQIKKSNIRKDSEGEVPGKYTAKILYRWDNKRFDREYKKNQRNQKEQNCRRNSQDENS